MFHTCLLDVKLAEDDLKKFEIFRNISELYLYVKMFIFLYLLVLNIKLFLNTRL